MVKQKLGLKFHHGLIIGTALSISLMSVIMDKMYVSRDVLKLKSFYYEGKLYKLCRYK